MDSNLFEKTFVAAYDDMFRGHVFGDLKRSDPECKNKSILKAMTIFFDPNQSVENLLVAQVVLLAYLEQKSYDYYQIHHENKAYLDEFKKIAEGPPCVESLIVELLKENDKFPHLREAVMGILVTSATATCHYDDSRAIKSVMSLFDLVTPQKSPDQANKRSDSPAESTTTCGESGVESNDSDDSDIDIPSLKI